MCPQADISNVNRVSRGWIFDISTRFEPSLKSYLSTLNPGTRADRGLDCAADRLTRLTVHSKAPQLGCGN